MSWWKKERDLSIEEALEKTKQEFAPYWLKTDPLIVGVVDPENGEVRAYPLARNFGETPWLFFFYDLTSPATESVFTLSKEWGKRFKGYQVNFAFVFRQSYQFFKNKFLIRQTLDKYKINEVTALDHENLLSRGFQISEFPSIALFYKGKVVLKESLVHFSPEVELKIHRFLRNLDPGLPLSPPFNPVNTFYNQIDALELGNSRGCKFEKFPVPENPEERTIYLGGKWIHETDTISTADLKAELLFKAPSQDVFIFARSLSKAEEPSKMLIYIDDSPVFDMFFGKDLTFDESGNSSMIVKEGRIYSALHGLPKDKRLVRLKFPSGRKAPIALYSFSFCK